MNNLTTLQAFVQNPNHYAIQNADGYLLIREEITEELLRKHLAGDVSIGTYFLFLDKARAFAFDIDTGDRAMAVRLGVVLRSKGLLSVQEFSGRKGYHVWCLLQDWEPSTHVVRLARAIAAQAEFDGEVFPKQASARDTGSMMKLPLGVHAVNGKRSRLLGATPIALQGNPHERFRAAVSSLPVEEPVEIKGRRTFRCMESIQDDPPIEGERNIVLYHFAVMLRKSGLDDRYVSTVLHGLNNSSPDPEDAEKVESIVERAIQQGGLQCENLRPERQCGGECWKRQFGLRPRPGYLRGSAPGESVVVLVEKHEGNKVYLDHPDAAGAMAVLKRENPEEA